MAQHQNRRLVGWKAIAAYLGKDVRTLLRWERERGLPVHRPPGRGGQSVYAMPEELDRWIAQPRTATHSEWPPAAPTAPARRIPLWAAVTAISLLIAAGAAAGVLRPAAQPARIEIRDLAVRAFDRDGAELWAFPLPGDVATPSVQNGVGRTTHLGDIDGDGTIEALASVVLTSHSPDTARAVLLCLNADGTLKWAQELDDQLDIRGRKYGPPWAGADLLVYGEAPRTRIAFAAHHYTWSPSVTVALSPGTGERLASYVHDGWIMRLGVTGDERHVIAAAVHGSHDGHAVSVLRALDFAPHAYFVVPRPDASIAAAESLDRQYYAIADNSVPTIRLAYTRSVDPVPEAVLELSPDRRSARMILSPAYREWHDRLARAGAIPHTALDCPELSAASRVLR